MVISDENIPGHALQLLKIPQISLEQRNCHICDVSFCVLIVSFLVLIKSAIMDLFGDLKTTFLHIITSRDNIQTNVCTGIT